jgi:hypothetical protein
MYFTILKKYFDRSKKLEEDEEEKKRKEEEEKRRKEEEEKKRKEEEERNQLKEKLIKKQEIGIKLRNELYKTGRYLKPNNKEEEEMKEKEMKIENEIKDKVDKAMLSDNKEEILKTMDQVDKDSELIDEKLEKELKYLLKEKYDENIDLRNHLFDLYNKNKDLNLQNGK